MVIAVLCAAVGILSVPAAAASEEEVSIQALIELTFTSVKDGRLLDVQDGSRDDGAVLSVNPAPGSAQLWRVNTENTPDKGFTIVNATTGKCINADGSAYQLRQQPCDGRASEKWYFQPVTGSAQKAFLIRHVADNACLIPQLPGYNDNRVYTYECDGAAYQQWTVPTEVYKKVFDTAVDYAAARCTKDTSTCAWNTSSQQEPQLLPQVCVSPLWLNDTEASVQWTFSLHTSSGWTNTIGAKFTASLEVGGGDFIPIKGIVSGEVSGSTTWDLRQDLGDSLVITVPQRRYGWVALSELATKVTGTWTFDVQGFPWTVEDTVTVPLKHDPAGGASVYHAKTRTEFTSCAG